MVIYFSILFWRHLYQTHTFSNNLSDGKISLDVWTKAYKNCSISTNVIPVSQVDHINDIMIVISRLANLNKSVVSKYNFLKDRTGMNALRFQKILIWVFVLSKHPIIPRVYPSMCSLLGVPPKSLGRSVWRTKKFRIKMTIFVYFGPFIAMPANLGQCHIKTF